MKKSFFWLSLFVLAACGSPTDSDQSFTEEKTESLEFYGNTQGTTYSIIVNDNIDLSMEEVESVLASFDQALSSYIPESDLSKINNSSAGEISILDEQGYFADCLNQSYELYQMTNGAFDPTVYPLVDGWGFMKDEEFVPDSSTVDSLRSLLGFNNGYHFKWTTDSLGRMQGKSIIKNTSAAKLDFNAIAQGQAVDVLAELIESRGGENYFVEIGGELRVKGLNKDGVNWRIGIDKPIEESDETDRELQEVIQLDNKAVATSGSYRKFYIKNGEKYSHTLNPKTGYPVQHNLLSATVVADQCSTADALATAFMVMGTEKAKGFVKEHPELGIDVYLIFTNDKDRLETWYTAGFAEIIVED